MKKGIITLSIIFLCILTYAQNTEMELGRSAFQLQKKAMVAEFLQLSDADAAIFWPIYNKYEQERTDIGGRRLTQIKTYSEKYENMDDETADALVNESLSIKKNEFELKKKYYEIVKKSISTSTAARFYQIEDAITATILAELSIQFPLLEKK